MHSALSCARKCFTLTGHLKSAKNECLWSSVENMAEAVTCCRKRYLWLSKNSQISPWYALTPYKKVWSNSSKRSRPRLASSFKVYSKPTTLICWVHIIKFLHLLRNVTSVSSKILLPRCQSWKHVVSTHSALVSSIFMLPGVTIFAFRAIGFLLSIVISFALSVLTTPVA